MALNLAPFGRWTLHETRSADCIKKMRCDKGLSEGWGANCPHPLWVETEGASPGAYWRKMKQRLGAEDSEVVCFVTG